MSPEYASKMVLQHWYTRATRHAAQLHAIGRAGWFRPRSPLQRYPQGGYRRWPGSSRRTPLMIAEQSVKLLVNGRKLHGRPGDSPHGVAHSHAGPSKWSVGPGLLEHQAPVPTVSQWVDTASGMCARCCQDLEASIHHLRGCGLYAGVRFRSTRAEAGVDGGNGLD